MEKHGDIIFKALVGSHSYGTNVEGSDMDYKGVYIQSPEDVLINGYREQYSVNKDETYFEIRRFIDLCATSNPTMLELLFTPEDCIIEKHPVFDILLKQREKFLTKQCKWSFGGYAKSQITKAAGLDKKMNWEKERIKRKDILDFCHVLDPESKFNTLPLREYLKREEFKQEYCGLTKLNHFKNCYALFYDYLADLNQPVTHGFRGIASNPETSNDVVLSDVANYCVRSTIMFFNLEGYQTHCKDYKKYQHWLKERNELRYTDTKEHGQKIDGKNLLHCVRLLNVAKEIAEGKGLNVKRPEAEYLIGIRKGKYKLEEILANCNDTMKYIDEIFDKSNLPNSMDRSITTLLTREIRQEYQKQLVSTKEKGA